MGAPQISIILGSGFSIPEGLPSVSVINQKLKQLKESDFFLFSDQSAGFYKSDWIDPNSWMSYIDRFFAQEFTSFYCIRILNNDLPQFNYEVFYDYISGFLRYKKDKLRIEAFCDEFRKKINNNNYFNDNHNLVRRFSKIFNQLIADLLFVPKYYEDVSYGNYPQYGAFFSFLRETLKDKIVNVHTLNHDLFFDHLASKHGDLWQHFTDGFSEYGSSYYGDVSFDYKGTDYIVHKSYKVRLKYYTGKYDNNLKLFKLHGSIDYTKLHDTKNGEIIRVKRDYGVGQYYFEKYDEESKKYIYESPFDEKEPDYLTGTTEKLRKYNDPFYEKLFQHFKNNLNNSEQLLVIGYGFQDKGINEYIENNFLIFNKEMLVIDVKKPTSDLFDKYSDQITFSDKGVTGISYDELMLWKK